MPFPLISGETTYNISGDPVRVEICPPAKTTEGKAALDAIWARKRLAAKASQKSCRIVGLLSFIATPVCLYYFGPELWTYFLPLGWLLMSADAQPGRLTEAEYYSVPGSRDANGKHQCIYCGNHDVTRTLHNSGVVAAVHCGNCHELLH